MFSTLLKFYSRKLVRSRIPLNYSLSLMRLYTFLIFFERDDAAEYLDDEEKLSIKDE